jgi:hypothetical protein
VAGPPTSGGQMPVRNTQRIGLWYGDVAAIRHLALWRQLRVPAFASLLVAIALTLIRARDQPGVDLSLGSTTATIVPGDVDLVVLLVVSLVTIARAGLPRSCRPAVWSGVAFAVLVVATGASNGTTTFVSSAKLAELAVLALGAALLVGTDDRLEAVVDTLLLFTIVADVVGVIKFATGGGGRQSAFLGEHDFAALATLPLLYGLVLVFQRRRPARAAVSIVAGSVGCTLGAALASLLGLYLGALALLVIVAAQRALSAKPVAVLAVTLALVTAATLTLRSGDLGFLQSWFGKPESRPGQYAASWSQRLIYTYIEGRVFLAHPVLGVGWYPNLPPKEFERYLPAAHKRFSDQPPRYFPPTTRSLPPQQAFDEVAAELGVVGLAAFLALLVSVGRIARRAALPAAWFAATIGAIAGEALFGGTPLTATFWFVTGLCLTLGTWQG